MSGFEQYPFSKDLSFMTDADWNFLHPRDDRQRSIFWVGSEDAAPAFIRASTVLAAVRTKCASDLAASESLAKAIVDEGLTRSNFKGHIGGKDVLIAEIAPGTPEYFTFRRQYLSEPGIMTDATSDAERFSRENAELIQPHGMPSPAPAGPAVVAQDSKVK